MCKGADLSAGAGRAGSGRRGWPASGLGYFGTRSPAGPLEAVVAVVGSAVQTAAAPWGCSVAAFGRAELGIGSETLQQAGVGW